VKRIRCMAYGSRWESICSEIPNENAYCYACMDKCENYKKMYEEATNKFLKELASLLDNALSMGFRITDFGSENCIQCPMKGEECGYCRLQPPFYHLQRPCILVMINSEEVRKNGRGIGEGSRT